MGGCFSKDSSSCTSHAGYGCASCCKDQSLMHSCCHVKPQSGTDSIAQVSAPTSKMKEEDVGAEDEEERRKRRRRRRGSHRTCIDQSSITPSLDMAAENRSSSPALVPPSSSSLVVETIAVAGDKFSGSLQLHYSGKKSGELAMANSMNTTVPKMIRASSPRKNPILNSLLPAPPSAPVVTKTDSARSTSSLYRRKDSDHGEEEEEEEEDEEDDDDDEEGKEAYGDQADYKFRPSQARKVWLSEVQTLTLPASTKSSLETLTKGKIVSSRTNSFSRIPDPVIETSSKNSITASASASARPATYNSAPLQLRRSPSANDSTNGDGGGGGGRLCRNPSVKTQCCTDQKSASNISEAFGHGSSDLQQKPRTPIKTTHNNKHSLSAEFVTLDASASVSMAHKRSSSRDSAPLRSSHEVSMDSHTINNLRRPSPPKKNTSLSSSSSDAIAGSRQMTSYSSRRGAAAPIKAEQSSNPSHKPHSSNLVHHQNQEHGLSNSTTRNGARTLSQKSVSQIDLETMGSDGNRNSLSRKDRSPLKRKEKSPLRRAGIQGANAMTTSSNSCTSKLISNAQRNAPDISMDDWKGKDLYTTRTKKLATRLPLKDISDNSTNHVLDNPTFSKHTVKESTGIKTSDDKAQVLKDASNCNVVDSMKANPLSDNNDAKLKTVMLDLGQDFDVGSKDPLEMKAESLVMGGKSVLSAFRALEEYRLKYANLNLEPGNDASRDDDVLYSRLHHRPIAREKESFSQPLAQGETAMGGGIHEIRENIPGHEEQVKEVPLTRSRSANKRSCEPFLFPDVQSLLMMPETLDGEESNMEGEEGAVRVTMPASISKACSILKAVADLNKGTCVVYPQRKEKSHVDENYIERPNLLSFQFGDGDSNRVTTG